MKFPIRSLILSAGFLLSVQTFAQTATTTPTPSKPAASAAASQKNGALTAKPSVSDAATPAAANSTKSLNKAAAPATAAAQGGGDGKVWVNTASKTYHCTGTKYYGKTKAGEYMSEADAKAKGNHADHKKACS